MVPSAGSAPAPPRSQQGMLLLHYEGSVKNGSSGGFRARMGLFTRQVPCYVGHGGVLELVRSAGIAPASQRWHGRVLLLNDDRINWCSHEDLHLELPPSQSGVHDSYTLRALKMVRHVGVAPTYSVWKTGMLLLHQCRVKKWPLELVARQPLRVFSPPLICLSHPA